jgi:hypothetical protein
MNYAPGVFIVPLPAFGEVIFSSSRKNIRINQPLILRKVLSCINGKVPNTEAEWVYMLQNISRNNATMLLRETPFKTRFRSKQLSPA